MFQMMPVKSREAQELGLKDQAKHEPESPNFKVVAPLL